MPWACSGYGRSRVPTFAHTKLDDPSPPGVNQAVVIKRRDNRLDSFQISGGVQRRSRPWKRWRLRCPKGEHDVLRTGPHPTLRRAGIRQVRFHDLRHSFASNLLAADVDVVTVSKALGHANVHITLVTYAHPIPKERHGAGDALARLLAQSGNKMETSGSETVSAA